MGKTGLLAIVIVVSTASLPLSNSAYGKDASPAAKPTATTATTTRRTLTSQGVSCSIEPPAGFSFTKKETAVGPIFVFADPTKEKKAATLLSVSIVKADKTPDENEFMDGVLDPYRKGLKNYLEKKGPRLDINGSKFENRRFSGNFSPSGIENNGFVYCTVRDGSYISIMANANGLDGLGAILLLMPVLNTFR